MLIAEDVLGNPLCERCDGLGELAVFEEIAEHPCAEADDTCTTTERIHSMRICIDGLLTLSFKPVGDSLTELRTNDSSLLCVRL